MADLIKWDGVAYGYRHYHDHRTTYAIDDRGTVYYYYLGAWYVWCASYMLADHMLRLYQVGAAERIVS